MLRCYCHCTRQVDLERYYLFWIKEKGSTMWAKKQLLVVWGHIKTTLHYKDCLEDHSSWQVVIRISIYKPWSSAIWKGNVAKLTGLTNNCSSARSQVLGMILQVCHRPIPRNPRTRQNLFPTVSITSWICGGWNDQRNGGSAHILNVTYNFLQ